MTVALIILNVLIFFYEVSLPEKKIEILFHYFGLVPARYSSVSWLKWLFLPYEAYVPFLTSTFLHGGFLHLLTNMWSLWLFGDNVEDLMGHFRFLVFYLLCGIVAGFIHILTNSSSILPVVGASGAIAGVMGAYYLLFPRSKIIIFFPIIIIPFFFQIPAVLYLGIWFLGQLLSGTASLASPETLGGVAFWAHIGGFVGGMWLYRWFIPRKNYIYYHRYR